MGVEFYTCAKCGDTYPDCGPHDRCENHHGLGPCCMNHGIGHENHEARDDDGALLAAHCPVCQSGGTELEKLRAERDRAVMAVLLLVNDGVISASRAKELLGMSHQEQRAYFRACLEGKA